MAGLWDAALRGEAAVRRAALAAVDAALLEGVLMRTEAEPNASDVSPAAPRPPQNPLGWAWGCDGVGVALPPLPACRW